MYTQLKSRDGKAVQADGRVCLKIHGKTYVKKKYYRGPVYLFTAWEELKAA